MAAADDFYLKHGYGGHFGGRTLIQAHGKIGGHRSVFINLVSGNKDAFVYPPFGGVITNPFKGRAKAYAGDFCEYDPDTYGKNGGQTVKILKYYELAKAATNADTDILVVNDGYHHIPFAGDNIMVAQSDFTKKSLGCYHYSCRENNRRWQGCLEAHSFSDSCSCIEGWRYSRRGRKGRCNRSSYGYKS